jgi:hypothetical protein
VLLGAPLCFQAEKPVPRRACHLGAVRPAGGGHLSRIARFTPDRAGIPWDVHLVGADGRRPEYQR